MRYHVQRGVVEVKARSSIHDTTTRFGKVEGTIDFDPDAAAEARAELSVDMRVFDAGDRFKNWKIKSDLDPDAHPTATFALVRLDSIHEATSGRFEARALGQIRWRGKGADVTVKGEASVDRRRIEASASFEMNVRDLGVSPPRFLMFKVEDHVVCQVSLVAVAAS
jgi:polyisoprenoid-binding protein YceI